jgi:hypothetical protein
MTFYLFNDAPGEHVGPEGFVTCPTYNPHWTASSPVRRRRSTDGGRDRAKKTHSNRGRSTVGRAAHLLTSHTVHYNPAQVPCGVIRSDRPEMVH